MPPKVCFLIEEIFGKTFRFSRISVEKRKKVKASGKGIKFSG